MRDKHHASVCHIHELALEYMDIGDSSYREQSVTHICPAGNSWSLACIPGSPPKPGAIRGVGSGEVVKSSQKITLSTAQRDATEQRDCAGSRKRERSQRSSSQRPDREWKNREPGIAHRQRLGGA